MNQIKHKLLMTGASGFIGSHFHNVLPHEQIVNLDLNAPKFKNKAHFVKGDIRKIEDVERALATQDCDTILSLAAEHKDFGISRDDYFKTNEFGTKVLCDAATKKGIKNFIFYSSVAIYGNNTTPSDEEMTPNPSNHYGASKLAGEKVLRAWAAEDPERKVLVIRPVVVYGERNLANMYRLIEQIRKGRYFHIGEGKNVKSIAYVRNLVAGTMHLMQKMEPGFHAFNYADEPQLSSREIANTISQALGKNNPLTLPYALVYAMGIPFDIAIKLTGKDLPISTNRVKKFCTETYHTASKIRNAGFVPEYSNVTGLQRMVKWMNESSVEKPQLA